MLRLRIAAALAVSLLGTTACAADSNQSARHASHFGFTFDLPANWIAVTPESVAKATKDVDQASLGDMGTLDPAVKDALFARVRAGGIEFYYDGPSGNNVSAQVTEEQPDLSETAVAEFCNGTQGNLESMWGSGAKLIACGKETKNGVAYLSFEYLVAEPSQHVMQQIIPTPDGKALALVGGAIGDTSPLPGIRAVQVSMLNGLTKWLSKPAQ